MRQKWLLPAGVLSVLLLGSALWWLSTSQRETKPPASRAPSEQQASTVVADAATDRWPDSPFLNTRLDVAYVGTQACLECHLEQHATFQHTGMGRSMAEVDLNREPPDAAFDHPPSGKRYEVLRRDGQLWHREWKLVEGGEPVLLQEYPMKYVTGSGRHSLTYIYEVEGFWYESPITWYASRQAWGMSPGYDRPHHASFQREVGESCLVCHAGRIETIDRSLHRFQVIEAAIGCERCHGPGALHVAARRQEREASAPRAEEVIDPTIVNPAHLSRELAEAICQQCHLRVEATVLLTGRKASDFRPGLPLQTVRLDLVLHDTGRPMTVVGHVDQMHRSACYQRSATFTCTTCHNPHGEPPPEQRTAYYTARCQQCHAPETCTVDSAQRERLSPENNCLHCHMPTTPTDIPHLAFTHHRVGIHTETEPATAAEGTAPLNEDHAAGSSTNSPAQPARLELQPFLQPLHLTPGEELRAQGLGFLDLAMHAETPEQHHLYRQEALRRLQQVYQAGQADGVVLAALASLLLDAQQGGYGALAEAALADPQLDGLQLCNALFAVADAHYREERPQLALAALERLNQVRRHSLQWLLWAECERKRGHLAGLETALQHAVRINPNLSQVHRYLANVHEQRGETERARFHAARAAP